MSATTAVCRVAGCYEPPLHAGGSGVVCAQHYMERHDAMPEWRRGGFRYLSGNPWKKSAPACHLCDSNERVYLWRGDETPLRWYCAPCDRFVKSASLSEVGRSLLVRDARPGGGEGSAGNPHHPAINLKEDE